MSPKLIGEDALRLGRFHRCRLRSQRLLFFCLPAPEHVADRLARFYAHPKADEVGVAAGIAHERRKRAVSIERDRSDALGSSTADGGTAASPHHLEAADEVARPPIEWRIEVVLRAPSRLDTPP